jgi:hypothetical protein
MAGAGLASVTATVGGSAITVSGVTAVTTLTGSGSLRAEIVPATAGGSGGRVATGGFGPHAATVVRIANTVKRWDSQNRSLTPVIDPSIGKTFVA